MRWKNASRRWNPTTPRTAPPEIRPGSPSRSAGSGASWLRSSVRSILTSSPGRSSRYRATQQRPQTRDYIELIFEQFLELHGDRAFGDDKAIVTGLAHLDDIKVMFLGHQKGKNLPERKECNFGCAHPEGYRKALLKMRLAEKFGLPIISFIDTPGAYPGITAEERGQAAVIAENLMAMSQIRTPIVGVVIGEGGSGGALGIGIGDRLAMLEFTYYSVISPEGCASILWKGSEHAPKAAAALKLTSRDLLRFGIIDEVIAEPPGGAHRDHREAAASLKTFLIHSIRQLREIPTDELVSRRYDKYRKIGVYLETPPAPAPEPDPAPERNGPVETEGVPENE